MLTRFRLSVTSYPVTWAEAEKLFPGCAAEWDEMSLIGGDFCPPPNLEIRLEIQEVVTADAHLKLYRALQVIQTDPEGKWHYPPTWVRGTRGHWNHPIPTTKAAFSSIFLVSYDYKKVSK